MTCPAIVRPRSPPPPEIFAVPVPFEQFDELVHPATLQISDPSRFSWMTRREPHRISAPSLPPHRYFSGLPESCAGTIIGRTLDESMASASRSPRRLAGDLFGCGDRPLLGMRRAASGEALKLISVDIRRWGLQRAAL